jgi:hydroxyacyl-ACP dehydratase HTD2-like protein with hotdog domain
MWSPIGLFRFSALTFNAHKIHYDQTWSVGIENHKGLVVHGPINLLNMLDYWRDVCGKGIKEVAEVVYRATSPLYAGDVYQVLSTVAEGDAGKYDMVVEKDGKKCLTGTITEA